MSDISIIENQQGRSKDQPFDHESPYRADPQGFYAVNSQRLALMVRRMTSVAGKGNLLAIRELGAEEPKRFLDLVEGTIMRAVRGGRFREETLREVIAMGRMRSFDLVEAARDASDRDSRQKWRPECFYGITGVIAFDPTVELGRLTDIEDLRRKAVLVLACFALDWVKQPAYRVSWLRQVNDDVDSMD